MMEWLCLALGLFFGVFLREGLELVRPATLKTAFGDKLEVLKIEYVEGTDDKLITLNDGTQWRGYSTVWKSYPDGRRAGTNLEVVLAEVCTAFVWQRKTKKDDIGRYL